MSDKVVDGWFTSTTTTSVSTATTTTSLTRTDSSRLCISASSIVIDPETPTQWPDDVIRLYYWQTHMIWQGTRGRTGTRNATALELAGYYGHAGGHSVVRSVSEVMLLVRGYTWMSSGWQAVLSGAATIYWYTDTWVGQYLLPPPPTGAHRRTTTNQRA